MYDDRDPAHCHPRAYGTFSGVLGTVRPAEGHPHAGKQAIRKMTALSAARMGLRDRGLLKPGYVADITVFDPETVTDKGDYVKSRPEARWYRSL
jgi:N-acyl-D-aspartate/D-glutamate deacylase